MAEWLRRDAGAALPESLVAQIYHRTGGVPLLVEEFTRMARESTVFESAGITSPRVSTASTRELPQTLQELVMVRLDRMSSYREALSTVHGVFPKNFTMPDLVDAADMNQPDQVLAKLNDVFQGEHGERFFTIWYGVYHCASRTMTWSGGGHPPSIVLLPGESNPLRRLDHGCPSWYGFPSSIVPNPFRRASADLQRRRF
jgi:hypothetical protein